MGVYRRKDGTYWFIKQYKGRKAEESLHTKLKALADKRYAEILPKIIDGTYFEKPKQSAVPTVKEVMDRYIREVSPQQLAHHRNQAIYDYWLAFFGENLLMTEVTKSRLSTYKARRLNGEIKHRSRNAGESTVKKELSFLRQAFNHAIDAWDDDWDGFFKTFSNPVKKVIKGMADGERIRYVTEQEASALAKHLPQWLFDIVVVACDTGWRRAKVVMLEKAHLDFAAGWINPPKRSRREKNVRPVKMTGYLRAFLLKIMERANPDSPYLFADEDGKAYSLERVSMAFRRACDAAGIKNLRFHDLRHDFATRLINSGANLYQVQHQLAHSDPRITQRYAHLLPENQNVVDRIDGIGTTPILVQSSIPARELTSEQAGNLAHALPQWLFDIVVIAAETRLPRKKVLSLLKTQIDIGSGWITIPPTEAGEKEIRQIKLTATAKAFLRTVLQKTPGECQYLFCDAQGKPYIPARVSVAFRRACQAVGINDEWNLRDLGQDFAVHAHRVHGTALGQQGTAITGAKMPSGRAQKRSIGDKIQKSTTILRRSKEKELRSEP